MTRFIARTALVFSLAFSVACGDDDPTGPSVTATLVSGTPITAIAGGEDSQRLYKIPITAGATLLRVTTSGGTGDVDILVRRGSPPTETSVDDCGSFGDTNAETCDVPNPAAGDWFILLYGAQGYSGVTLTATVTRP